MSHLVVAAVPLVWAIGIVLIIIGIAYILRGSPLGGGILIPPGDPPWWTQRLDRFG